MKQVEVVDEALYFKRQIYNMIAAGKGFQTLLFLLELEPLGYYSDQIGTNASLTNLFN